MNNSLYEEVNKQFNSLKEKKKSEYRARVGEVYEKVPKIREIDEGVSKLVFEMFSKAAAGADCDAVVESFSEKLKAMKEEKNALLIQNGFKSDYLAEIYNCKKCGDTGIYNGKQCECYKKIVTSELLKYSNLGKVLAAQTFSKFDISLYSDKKIGDEPSPRQQMTEILSSCKKFAVKFPKTEKSLLFYGGSGLGKTFMSSAIANEVMKKGNTVIYQTAADIFAALEDAKFGRASDSMREMIERIYDVDLLIIDDLGTEYRSPHMDAEFFRILNSRILSGKSIIISTNFTLAQLKKTYSERIFSRIIGYFNIYKFAGKDIRCKDVL